MYKPDRPYWKDAAPRSLKHDTATPEGRRELREALKAHNATVGESRPSPHYDPTSVDPSARYKPSQPYYAEDGTVGGVGQMNEKDRQTFADVRPSVPSNNREVDAILAKIHASGESSLARAERRTLERHSRRQRERRDR